MPNGTVNVKDLINQQKKNLLANKSMDENSHPNIRQKDKKMSKEITVFNNAFSPDDNKCSANKRYKDHFDASERQNDEFSENDILYELCDNEKRPSKDVTSNNTALNTLREDSHVVSYPISAGGSSRSTQQNEASFWCPNSRSSKELSSKFTKIEIAPKLRLKGKDVESSPQFASLIVPQEQSSIDKMASMVMVDISEKNTEKHKKMIKNEEKYEQDIRALKKRLDYMNNSNYKLIESSMKKQGHRTFQHSSGSSERKNSDYIYTERKSNEDISFRSDSRPDIMQYVNQDSFDKSIFNCLIL